MVNMDHLNYLDTVRSADVALLREKEKTYQGSWKKGGGRSAWYMARRNMDRLITMLTQPQPPSTFNQKNVADTIDAIKNGGPMPGTPEATVEILTHLQKSYVAEDVFARIEEDPSGADGTVLACIRDLRCYFTLIEAEMMARGVVIPVGSRGDSGTTGSEGYRFVGQSVDDLARLAEKQKSFREMLTDELQTERGRLVEANNRAKGWGAAVGARGEVIKEIDSELDRRARSVKFHATEESWSRAENKTYRPGTPEDGGHHARQPVENHWPIELPIENSSTVFDKFGISSELRDKFWHVRGQMLVLDAFVTSRTIPRAIADWFTLCQDRNTWMIKIGSVPPELRDRFGYLHRERNSIELGELPASQIELYAWQEAENKWLIRDEYAAWTRED